MGRGVDLRGEGGGIDVFFEGEGVEDLGREVVY